ncbi:hypothetical protein GCM10009634_73600 [Saccharothrix xinjiangensis]
MRGNSKVSPTASRADRIGPSPDWRLADIIVRLLVLGRMWVGAWESGTAVEFGGATRPRRDRLEVVRLLGVEGRVRSPDRR